MLNGKLRMPDIIIDFDDYENSIQKALLALDIPIPKVIPHADKTQTKQPKDELAKNSDVIAAVMNSHHAEDFETFDFMGWTL